MGYIRHNAIIVTDWDINRVKIAHTKAREIFETLRSKEFEVSANIVSEIVRGITNGQASFFIAPDGSKEGWPHSDNADKARGEFLDWLKESHQYCDYVEIRFGGDTDGAVIVRDEDSDLDEKEVQEPLT